MVTSGEVRRNVTLFLKEYDIDATKVLQRDISEEGYLYLRDPKEARLGKPVEEFVAADRDGKATELRAWPDETVYPNLLRILAGEKPLPVEEVRVPRTSENKAKASKETP